MKRMRDSRTPRLYVEAGLGFGEEVELAPAQAHYLRNVLRLGTGDWLALFNSRDGEWLCRLTESAKRGCRATCNEKVAEPELPPDIDYLFAPLKAARLDYLAQKATEMGVRRLRPVLTERTVPQRVNLDRLRANTVEAAEQCNLVFVPEILEPVPLPQVLKDWPSGRRLIHADEGLARADPLQALRQLKPGPLAVLIGPEGGFGETERAMLGQLSFVVPVSLGPRIMRADTAAVALLALVQAVLGDWRSHQSG
jgi:16S rRNA (uracil1498-N3)-methyltransferase